ncbi:hypothetical protein BST37_12445, partial [Mycobacterium noviomagense]
MATGRPGPHDEPGGAAGRGNLAIMRVRRSLQVALCAALLVSSGCARFNDAQSQPFTTEPQRRPPATST